MWMDITNRSRMWEVWIALFKVKVTVKVQLLKKPKPDFSISSEVLNFLLPTLIWLCIMMIQSVVGKVWKLFSTSRFKWGLKVQILCSSDILTTEFFATSQSSRTKVFASCSFQDMCGELIGVVQDRPVQSPPFVCNRLWGAFRMHLIIQEIKIAQKNQNQREKN